MWRSRLIFFTKFATIILFFPSVTLDAMRPANRDFPFSNEVFRTSKHNGLDFSTFFTRASSSYESLSGKESVTHPWGGYNLRDAIAAYKTYRESRGESFINPIEAEKGSDIWNNSDIFYDVLTDQRGYGVLFSFYHMFDGAASKVVDELPLSESYRTLFDDMEFYVGADLPVIHASSAARYEMNLTSISNLFVHSLTARDRLLIDKVRRYFQQDDLGLISNTWSACSIGDLDIYMGLGKKFDYTLRFRSIDLSVVFGCTFPICEKSNIDRPLSFSFGAEGVTFHSNMLMEFELKRGWRAGCTLGLTSGWFSDRERRVPVKREPAALGPLKLNIDVNSGMTLTLAPYFTLENIQPGLHGTIKYIYTWHDTDSWIDDRCNPTTRSLFNQNEAGFNQALIVERFENWTSWSASHMSAKLVYDPGQRSVEWKMRPLIWASYDYPLETGSAVRNRKIALGVTLRF